MGLLPLPEKLQFEVIPYVSPVLSYPTKPNQPTSHLPTYQINQSASSHSPYSNFEFADMLSKQKNTAPLLGPRLLRRLSPGETRLRSSHFQRRSASPRGVDGADSRGEERFEEQGCGCGLRCGFCGGERESNTGLFTFFQSGRGEFDESREERSGYVWWWYMRSLVGKWQERRDEKGKARRTGKDKDKDGTGQDRNRELIIFAQ